MTEKYRDIFIEYDDYEHVYDNAVTEGLIDPNELPYYEFVRMRNMDQFDVKPIHIVGDNGDNAKILAASRREVANLMRQ